MKLHIGIKVPYNPKVSIIVYPQKYVRQGLREGKVFDYCATCKYLYNLSVIARYRIK